MGRETVDIAPHASHSQQYNLLNDNALKLTYKYHTITTSKMMRTTTMTKNSSLFRRCMNSLLLGGCAVLLVLALVATRDQEETVHRRLGIFSFLKGLGQGDGRSGKTQSFSPLRHLTCHVSTCKVTNAKVKTIDNNTLSWKAIPLCPDCAK